MTRDDVNVRMWVPTYPGGNGKARLPQVEKNHPIGFRPARLTYSAPHRSVMEQLGLPVPTKGAGKGRRSPKRETEGGSSPLSGSRRRAVLEGLPHVVVT